MHLLNIFKIITLSSLTGSVIVLLILLTKTIFRNKLNSTYHYYMWLILLIKLIIPLGPQTPLNISNLYKNYYVQSTINESTQKTQINSSEQFVNSNLRDSISISASATSNKSVIKSSINIPSNTKNNIKELFCTIWLFGIALLLGILFAGHQKLRKIIRTSIKNVTSAHKKILYDCMETMNIRTEVALSYSAKIVSPSLCGLIKPKILIPLSVAVNVCDDEFKYIVMHELTHLKNKDLFINWVITLLSIFHWFNPILLYGFNRMRQDCEFSCDSGVISLLDQGGHLEYGNALIRVLELACSSNRLVGTTPMVMNSSEIKRRITMISKYKKINIKGILLGTLVVIIIGSLGIALNTSNVSSDKNITKATVSKVETPLVPSKITVNSTPNAATTTIKKSSNANIKPIVPFSSDIVIYNSHADEGYPSGMKVTDVGALLNDKLVKEGFNSHFIKIDPSTEYNKSYQTSRDLIIKNVKSYSNTILLDIHREITEKDKSNARKILFVLTEKSPHYKTNKKLVDSLMANIKTTNGIESDIYLYTFGISYYNQDLSNNSALIEVGNDKSSDSDIQASINALVSALKSTQKSSPN
ncbi:stage II sporulation protein P [Clostridium bowmanii]|uniref:M56 family metallopeptidase n=1 Tax=Clostridium bowmanii TaxID=132925 RepID=UPI001C0BEFC4|nr:M56 family metallopeptidase [Clostridium bowmanii]MBU3190126.1 stage II sporulation protein P [Clostridium bowmanii]MCA1074721.1 stage II sporulation protein P [Clostridium bowmanii]